jgi:hypothetical protein
MSSRTRLALVAALLLGVTGCVSMAERTDITSVNEEDTGHYWVVASQEPEPGVLQVKLKLENLGNADRVVKDYVHQKVNLGYRQIRVDVIGPDDGADASPRRQMRWPGDVDYTVG